MGVNVFYMWERSKSSGKQNVDCGRIRAPNNVHILIPKICEYVILYSKNEFSDVTILRILRFRDCLDGSIIRVTAAIKN